VQANEKLTAFMELESAVELASQACIPTGERSGLLTHIATMDSGSLCVPKEKLTAFMELESAVEPFSASSFL
jgi:hypothetical protein